MLLAAVHLSPWWTIPPALLGILWVLWHWARLGCAHVPAARRRVRRISMTLIILVLPVLVMGISFVPTNQPRYAVTWTIALLLLLFLIVTAVADVIVTLRLHARQQEQEAAEAAGDLIQAMKRSRNPGP